MAVEEMYSTKSKVLFKISTPFLLLLLLLLSTACVGVFFVFFCLFILLQASGKYLIYLLLFS